MDNELLTIDEINKMPITFIVGFGRSGTTLLQTILDTHPNVLSTIESPFLIYLKKKYYPIKQWTISVVDEFLDDLYTEHFFKYFWNINKNNLRKEISRFPVNELSFMIICKLIYLNFPSPFKKDKIKLLIDKNPIYSLFIKDLQELFPDALFIHILRDYRDNIVSRRNVYGQNNLSLVAQTWLMYNVNIERFKNKHPAKFITIRYEDLVSLPEKHILELCRFLDISFQKEMLIFHQTTSNLYLEKKSENLIVTDLINKIQLNLMNPINTSQIGKWKNELTLAEIQLADFIAGNFGKKYNYLKVTDESKLKYYLIKIKAEVSFKVNSCVTVNYYKLPFYMRKLLRFCSDKLYNWFKYSNKFNKAKFHEKSSQNQNRN